MSQANVNVGTAPGAGNGDTLYNAFTKINNNFTELYSTITSSGTTYANIAPSVDSSASGSGLTLNITKYANIYGVSVNLPGTDYALGETVRIWGNVVGGTYTTHDLVVEVGTLANSSIGSVGTVTFTGTPSRPVLTVAGRTGDVVLTTNDIIGLRSTFSSNADIQSVVDGKIASNIANLIGTAPGVLDTLGEIADALNDDANVYNTLATSITTANVNLKGYTDDLVTTANTNMKGYVDAEITAIGAHYGNADVLAYLNDNSYATETYVDTANVNLKGYVDGEIATVTAGHYSNTEVLAYLTDNSYATETYVTTANTNLKGYTDNKFGTFTLNSGTNTVTTSSGDGNLKLAINGATSDDPPALISRQWSFNTDGTISFNDPFSGSPLANGVVSTTKVGQWDLAYGWGDHSTAGYSSGSDVTTANTNMKGYVDGQVTTLNSSITTANTNVVGYVDGEVTTLNSAITTANTNVVGYVDSAVTTANVNLKGYVDSEISDTVSATGSSIAEANTNMKGYVDGQVTTLNSTITTANTNVVGYVDNAVSTANVNLKGYVDAANVNVVGYIDNEINTLIGGAPGTLDTLNEIAAALGDDPNLATTLTNTITTANTNMKGYVDGQVTTLNSTITTANTNMGGYVDNAVSTANVNLKGYVDNELTGYATSSDLANFLENVVEDTTPQLGGSLDVDSYSLLNVQTVAGADGGNLFFATKSGATTTTRLTVNPSGVAVVGTINTHTIPGGTGTIALTSDVTTANVNLKGYVDNEISGLSLGNIATINLDGNVSNVLAGDGTFITAGSGGATAINDLTDVDTNTVSPSVSGQPLIWDTGDSNWYPGTFLQVASINVSTAIQVEDGAYINFEGATDDANETRLTVSDPTADRTITLPDATGTVALTTQLYTDSDVDTHLNQSNPTDGYVLSWTSGDYAWVAQSGGGLADVVDDTTPQLGGNLDLNGSYITGTGNIAITGNIIGDNRVTGSLTVDDSIAVENNVTLNGGTIQIEGQTGNISATNINLSGDLDILGNVTSALTIQSNDLTVNNSNVVVVGYVVGDTVTTSSGGVTITGADVTLGGNVTATQNIIGGALTSTGNIDATGSITGDSIFSLGNVVGVDFYGANFYGGNVTVADATIIFEGATADAFETTLAVTDPTADRTITFPDATGTVALTSDVTTANVNLKGYVDSLSHYEDSDVNTLLASWGSNTLSTTGNVTVGDAIVNSGVKEAYGALSSATGTVTHDCSNGHVFYHTSISSDFTANFTNLQLDTGYVTTLTLVLSQGATAYIASAVQIEGVAQTIKWQGNVTPTGTDNGVDAMSFSVINSSGTYTVLGQLVDFGG